MNKDQDRNQGTNRDPNRDQGKGETGAESGRITEAPGQPTGDRRREDEGKTDHRRDQSQQNRSDRHEDLDREENY